MKDHNNELEELFLNDSMYQFMLKQFEKDPEFQKILDIHEKHGVDKNKAIPLLLELTDMQEDEEDDDNAVELSDAKMNRTEDIEEMSETVELAYQNLMYLVGKMTSEQKLKLLDRIIRYSK